MHDLEAVEIPISKSKMLMMFFGCILFVAAGVSFVIFPETFISAVIQSKSMIFLAGCLSIIFFGIIGFWIFKRVIDHTPGLIISGEGITDNSSGISAGFIPWSDIVAVKETVVAKQRFIKLVVKIRKITLTGKRVYLRERLCRKTTNCMEQRLGSRPIRSKLNMRI
jgi:hypothetical protein